MKPQTLAAIVMVVGLIVVFIGPLILSALPTATYWTDEEQAAYEKASVAAHAATYGGAHDHSKPHSHEAPPDDAAKAHLEETRTELDHHSAKLKAAQSSQSWLRSGCRGFGLLVAATGVLIFVLARRAELK